MRTHCKEQLQHQTYLYRETSSTPSTKIKIVADGFIAVLLEPRTVYAIAARAASRAPWGSAGPRRQRSGRRRRWRGTARRFWPSGLTRSCRAASRRRKTWRKSRAAPYGRVLEVVQPLRARRVAREGGQGEDARHQRPTASLGGLRPLAACQAGGTRCRKRSKIMVYSCCVRPFVQ
jgi:hypothetical protein